MIDHYRILGLPSGEEGRNLTNREIKRAYKIAALKLHPDKRLSDPNTVAKFQQLQSSYELLVNDKTRKHFDDLLQAQQEDLRPRRRQTERSRRQEALLARWRQARSQEEVQSQQEDLRARWREDDLEAQLRQKDLWRKSEPARKVFIRKVEEEINRFRAWRANQSN